MSKIIKARISPLPNKFGDPMPVVTIDLDSGESIELFEYYPDEITFKTSEFIGLTVEEARQLKFFKTKAYIQS